MPARNPDEIEPIFQNSHYANPSRGLGLPVL